MLTVICPIYNEEHFIDKCICSIVDQDYPKEKLEFLLIDGRSTDRTCAIIETYLHTYSFIRLLDNPYKTVPYAMNIGIKEAKGDVIVRIDGHCEYPANYLSELEQKLCELKADNVGGVWNTRPASDTTVCCAIAIASSHPFGVGASKHKIGVKEITEVDTVPFGCYRRDVFDRIGFFDEELTRNQDDEFNARLINYGGKIYLIPSLVINYVARNTLAKMCRMYYQYGLFKPLVNKKLGAPATLRQFFPALFLSGIIMGGILSCLSIFLCLVYLGVLTLYLLLALLFSAKEASKNKNTKLILVLPATFFLVHMSYGYGYLKGVCKIVTRQSFSVNTNR